MSEKKIINSIYHAAVISGLSMGYSILSKRLLKMKVVDLDKLNVEDSMKLVAIIYASIMTKDFLVQQGIIPENISK